MLAVGQCSGNVMTASLDCGGYFFPRNLQVRINRNKRVARSWLLKLFRDVIQRCTPLAALRPAAKPVRLESTRFRMLRVQRYEICLNAFCVLLSWHSSAISHASLNVLF